MRKNKESQAALEFLTTYAWAFIGIMIAIGALYYFGVFDFSKYLPEKCVFTSQLECLAFVMDKDLGEIKIKLVNNLGETIDVESTNIEDNSNPKLECQTKPTTSDWESGEPLEPIFQICTGGGLTKKERMEAKVTITYCAPATTNCETSCNTPGCPKHTITGKLYGRVK